MVRKQGRRAAWRRAGLVAVLLVLAQPVLSQISTRVSDRFLLVGEQLTYVILIDHEEPSDVSVRSPVFDGLRLVDGPSIRPVQGFAGGSADRSVEVRFVFVATEPGRYVLPAVPVAVAGQSYLTPRHLLEVSTTRDRDSVPFGARWTGPSGPLLEGQSVVYALEIFNVREFLYPDTVVLGQAQRAILEEVQGLGDISRVQIDGVDLYTIPVAVFMVTATDAGSFLLPSVTIGSGPVRVTVPAQSISVDPLPEPVVGTGAVGRFEYTVTADPPSVPVGETIVVTQRVTGTGNLHFLTVPEIEVTGFQIADRQTRSQLLPRQDGYSGQIEQVVTLRALADGPHRIQVPAFASIRPESRQIAREPDQTLTPHVTPLREPVGQTGDEQPLEPLSPDQMQSVDRRVWFDSPLSYGWFVPGLLFLIATRLWKRSSALLLLAAAGLLLTDAVPDPTLYERAGEALTLYGEGDIEGAVAVLEDTHRLVRPTASLEHNLSVLYFKLGDIPRSVYAAREAIRLAPRNEIMRELLVLIEASSDIGRSIAPRHLIHPDLFFAALAVAVNLLFVQVALTLRKRNALLLVGQLVAGILIVVSFAGLAITVSLHNEQLAVVREEYDLRRIPSDESQGWLIVNDGTAVEVVALQTDFALVRTAVGLQGWVRADQLIWSGTPEFDQIRYRTASAGT